MTEPYPSSRPHRCEYCGELMYSGTLVVQDGDLYYHARHAPEEEEE